MCRWVLYVQLHVSNLSFTPHTYLIQIQLPPSFTMPLIPTLCGFLLFLYILPCCAAKDTITPGQALVGSEKLISSNGKFALGFFQTGSKSSQNTLNWYLGIWFNRVPKLTQVWVANGDNPLRDHTSSELTISNNGNLVILNQATNSTV